MTYIHATIEVTALSYGIRFPPHLHDHDLSTMGKIQPLLKVKPAANVAFNVVLDKRSVNKPILIAAILHALHDAGYSLYRTSHVETFMKDAVMPRKDLVRPRVTKATNRYRLQDVEKKERQYRINESFRECMHESTEARWNKQLKDAEDEATRWNTEHADHDPVAASKAAGRANLAKGRKLQSSIAAGRANLAKGRKLRWKNATAPSPSAPGQKGGVGSPQQNEGQRSTPTPVPLSTNDGGAQALPSVVAAPAAAADVRF